MSRASEEASELVPSARSLPVRRSPRARRYSRMRLAMTVVAAIALIAALYFARAFFVPLLIGVLLAYALAPLVDGLQKLHLPRAIGAAFVVLALVAAGSWLAYSLRDEATAMAQKLPQAARKLGHMLTSPRGGMPEALKSVQEAASELQRATGGRPTAAAPAPAVSSWLRDHAVAQSALLLQVAAETPIVLLLVYFLLASGSHFRSKLVRFLGPSLGNRGEVLRILEQMDTQLHGYLLVMLASNILVALAIWLSFAAIGLDFAAIWGLAAGILHFIPYLGALLVVIAAAIAALLQFDSLLMGLAVAGMTLVITGLIGVLFMTWLQSRFARLNAAVLFIALLFFGWLWGIAGFLLGAPLVAIVKVFCDRIDSLKPIGDFLGD